MAASHPGFAAVLEERLLVSFILWLPSGVMFTVTGPIFPLNSVLAQSQREFGFRGWEAALVGTVSGLVVFRAIASHGTTIATI